MDVRLPDGTLLQGVPEGTTKAQLYDKLKANGYDVSKLDAPKPEPTMSEKVKQGAGDLVAGAVRGAGSIGATILAPVDAAARALNSGKPVNIGGYDIVGQDRRAGMDAGLRELGADTNSLAFQGGKLGGEIAGTLGAGGAAANVLGRALPAATRAAPALEALRTAGMSAGGVQGLGGLALRTAGGAASGGLSAGLVNPADAGLGAMVGGAIPGGVMLGKAAGTVAGSAAGKAVKGLAGQVSPERVALARRANELGIQVPADRIANSKPLDAVASALNYVPFSGRAATENRLAEQLNSAASKLMGQDTPNINLAIRRAGQELGAKFDSVLKTTGVAFDQPLLDDIARVYNTAERELGSDALKAITSQVDELVSKGGTGTIDGKAAYNIKRTLDRIGNRNGPESFHALELKGVLMDALNRSLGPDGAKAFAQTRAQYGNMLALEKIAKNGVEGELSVARLANLKNINNKDLQELADIAATFVKPRESQHGAMQRAVLGLGTAAVSGAPGVAIGATAGRATNALLNSQAARNSLLGVTPPANALSLPAPGAVPVNLLRLAPILAGQTGDQ